MIEKVVLNGEEHKLSPEYKDVRNKPSINGVELKEGDNKIEIIDINIDPDVDIVEEGETPSVINTGTSKSPRLKFSLPKGDTGNIGNAYVPSVDENGNLSFTSTPNSELPSETPSYNIKGDRGVGLTATKTKNGKVTTVNITTEENEPVTELVIEDGKDAINPFKGYFPTGTAKPSSGSVGDYIYAPDSTDGSTTTIWKWNATLNSNNGDWEDTEVTIDAGSLAEFNSGETVAGTKIVDLYGDDGNHNIASAEGVKRLHDELLGTTVTSEETIDSNHETYDRGYWTLRTGYSALTDILFIRIATSGSTYSTVIKTYDEDLGIDLRGKKLKVSAQADKNTTYFVLAHTDNITGDNFAKKGETVFNNLIQEDTNWFSKVHIDDNNQFIPYFVITQNTEGEILIPNDAIRIVFVDKWSTGSSTFSSSSYLPTSITLINESHSKGTIDNLNENFDEIDENIDKIEQDQSNLETNLSSIENIIYGEESEIIQEADKTYLNHISFGSDKVYNTIGCYAYKIQIPGKTKITIIPGQYTTYYLFTIAAITLPSLNSNKTWATIRSQAGIPTDIDGYNGATTIRQLIYPEDSTESPHGQQVFENTSEDIRYLYVQGKFGNSDAIQTPSSILLTKTIRTGGIIDSEQTATAFNNIYLSYGKINDVTKKVEYNKKYVLTNLLDCSKGIWLHVTDNYAINNVYIYDYKGNLVNTKERPKYYVSGGGYFITPIDHYSSNKCLTGYYARVEIIKRYSNITNNSVLPSEDIDISDNIIKQFTYVDGDSRLSKWKFDTTEMQNAFKLFTMRCKIMGNVVWKALDDIPSTYQNFWFKKDTVNSGIPYSEASEFSKYVGYHVSLKTMLTALLNPRSVMYTENINQTRSSSKYGFTYHGINLASSFYGTVCTGYTSYVANLKDIAVSGSWSAGITDSNVVAKKTSNGVYKKNGTNYISASESDIWNLIEPMMFIWYDGHCSVISDVYYNNDNEKTFVIWSEETQPRIINRPLARKQFFERLNRKTEWKIISFTNEHWYNPDFATILENDDKLADYEEYVATKWNNISINYNIDKDISTFAGEYPAFCINKDSDESSTYNNYKAFLNIHRNNNYDTLEIYNENDTELENLIANIDISENSETFIYNSEDIYANDAQDKEDWIIVDLTQLPQALSAGKYKARVINSSDNESISGFTHFEMIEVSFNVSKDGNNLTCTYEVAGGTPYLIRGEDIDGLMDGGTRTYLTDNSASGTKSLSNYGTFNSYIKLFVKGDYGVVVKRLLIPS